MRRTNVTKPASPEFSIKNSSSQASQQQYFDVMKLFSRIFVQLKQK